jgi:thioredoxin-dependent peroxiredoxin
MKIILILEWNPKNPKGNIMTEPIIGKPAPEFSLPATEGSVSLAQYRGKNIVLYFYPKDGTPGCTLEGQAFRDLYPQFTQLNTIVLGISCDDIEAHNKFKCKENFPFDLLSDADEKVCQRYRVIKEKVKFGKPHRGIERSTFLIDAKGILRQQWRNVKVEGHAAAVLAAVKSLENEAFGANVLL